MNVYQRIKFGKKYFDVISTNARAYHCNTLAFVSAHMRDESWFLSFQTQSHQNIGLPNKRDWGHPP